MENGDTIAFGATFGSSPPPPPDPNVDDSKAATSISPIDAQPKTDEPLRLESERWDVRRVSPLGALRMLMEALEELAAVTGDVPPTPPVSRPSTPRPFERRHSRRPSSTPRRMSDSSNVPAVHIGSPEAQPTEPTTIEVGANSEDMAVQHAAIARRFFSKVEPPFTLTEYLLRMHHWCPHSSAVYLAAAVYCHRLCVTELMVPATSRTIHRLSLASIRIAAKVLEDNKWAQERVAKVGGVSNTQLLNLEVTLCFLLNFDLWVDADVMASRMFRLQQAARHGMGTKGRLGEQFKLRFPPQRKKRG